MRIMSRLNSLAKWLGALLDAMHEAFEQLRRKLIRKPSFTSVRWLSSRRIRQQYFEDQIREDEGLFDQSYIAAIDQKRTEAEKQFFNIALTQMTLTGFLLLAFVKTTASISIFGISSTEVYKFRDFLLFCHAITVVWSIIIQQYHHKLEDLIVAWVKLKAASEEAAIPMFLRYLGPLEVFNINVLPYKQNQFHNLATRNIFRIHGLLRLVSVLGIMSFTTLTPVVVAISLFHDPSNGWFSYAAICFWVVVMLFAMASAAINIFGVPYTDFSYAMKLDALMKSDPRRHKIVMAEITRTNKLVDLD
jgi:hypothetical protein